MKKVYGFSLGCKVNAYETNVLLSSFLSEGYERTDDPSEADLVLLNTCAVTAVAAQKSRQHIRKFRRLAPKATLVVMGCYSAEAKESLLSYGVDILAGTRARNAIVSAVEEFEDGRKPINLLKKGSPSEPYEDFVSKGARAQKSARAYLKIQDGCDKFCSYCLIPSLRGRSRSRLPESIFYEVKELLALGVKEIVLSGIEIGFYGKDLGNGSYGLGELLLELLSLFPELPRLRVSSLDESEITPSFLEAYRRYPSLMPHFHLSLQSGSSSVLKRMRRHYSPEGYLKAVSDLRSIRSETAITTDVIVGFPLESEEEWQETLSFCRKARFSEIHVFPFSPRKGTYAATLKEIPSDLKKKRVRELLTLGKELRKEYESEFYGKTLPVLFESVDESKGLSIGHTENYLLVSAPSKDVNIGQIAPVVYSEKTALD